MMIQKLFRTDVQPLENVAVRLRYQKQAGRQFRCDGDTHQHATTMNEQKAPFVLCDHDRETLVNMTRRLRCSPRKLIRARILLLSHDGFRDAEISALLNVGLSTIIRIRKRFREEGLCAALEERPRSGAPAKLTKEQCEALQRLMEQTPPEGNRQWSLRLLATQMKRMQVVDRISHETIRLALKKYAA